MFSYVDRHLHTLSFKTPNCEEEHLLQSNKVEASLVSTGRRTIGKIKSASSLRMVSARRKKARFFLPNEDIQR